MEKKGICSTCVNDADCTFNRKFPVIQCEEFSGIEPGPKKEEKNQEQEKIKSEQEVTGTEQE